MKTSLLQVTCLTLLFAVTQSVLAAGPTDKGQSAPVPLYSDLGNLHHPINTQVTLTQQYFDQGLRLTYAFNHAEAIRAFSEGARLDPHCAICYWGIALDYGPNINAPMVPDADVPAYTALQKALELMPYASEQERGYIQALSKRYANPAPTDRSALDHAYAQAMQQLATRYPDDLDAATLYAESMMDLNPWDYWTQTGDPKPGTHEITSTLESVIRRNPNHPGACHYYIHAVEAAYPEKAVPCADRLAGLMPGAGHLVHMPAHIYIRVGRYADAIAANQHAIHDDEGFIMDQHPMGKYPMSYYPHNIHFLSFAATMAGNSRLALDAAHELTSKVEPTMLAQIGLLQTLSIMPLHVEIRFGRWQDVLQEPSPPPDLNYPLGVWHYARGMAYLAQGKVPEADAELAELRKCATDPRMQGLDVHNGNTAAPILQIATDVLMGELAVKRGSLEQAVEYLSDAVNIEDRLNYVEPPSWPIPVRQELGAVLLASGQATAAEAVYRADLQQFPENGWSLYGLAASLRAQGKKTEADAVQARFQKAWATSDVTLTASAF